MRKKINFTKKDLLLIVVLGITILICNYILTWHSVYKEHKYAISNLSGYINEISPEEYETYLIEYPNTIVYFGDVNDEKTRLFEDVFLKTINRYYLNDKVVYVNTNEMDLEAFLSSYNERKLNIKNQPIIIYFENGKIENFINYDNNKMDNKSIIKFFRLYEEI